jgi:rhodanese-related sulfurtransferase
MPSRFVPVLIFCAVLAALPPHAVGQFAPTPIGATTIPAAQLMQAPELVRLLNSSDPQPLILQVGSRIFFAEAHIRGAQFAGPGSQPAGIELLEKTAASSPKGRLIVLYCGCCPWNRCPNVGPAFKRLHELGFTNVKVLYLANNFGDDWMAKGYPTDRK